MGSRWLGQGALGFAQFGALGAVDDVVAGHFMLAGAHEDQLNLVLNFFDVDGAARGHAAAEGGADLLGEFFDGFVHPAGGAASAAFYGQKGFGHGHRNFIVGIGHHLAVALDDAQLAGAVA